MIEQEKFYGRVNGLVDSLKWSIKWAFIISFWLVLWLFFPPTFAFSMVGFGLIGAYKIWKWGNKE